MERCAAMGFRGIGLDVAWLRKQLMIDDRILDPIYEKCQQLGLIASITCSFMLGDDFSFSHPDLIWHVAARYPKLKIVVPHACLAACELCACHGHPLSECVPDA